MGKVRNNNRGSTNAFNVPEVVSYMRNTDFFFKANSHCEVVSYMINTDLFF